jgi:hypothetical protein
MSAMIQMMNGKTVLTAGYTLDHDGYDEDGPESDLYDIFLVVKEGDENMCYVFHMENWYHSQPDIASFEEQFPLSESYFHALYADQFDFDVNKYNSIHWNRFHELARYSFSKYVVE